MARIALDAMGGDHAPQAPVAGALLALAELDDAVTVQLVGPPSVVAAELDRRLSSDLAHLAPVRSRVCIVPASDTISMSDRPSTAVRAKPDSSMVVGLRLQSAGESDGFVSAGNTGAQMAASVVLLKLHEGLTRPAIGTVFPTARQPVVVLDAGANVDCSAEELVQFARLGSIFAQDVLGRENPAVALLNVGEEPEKGSAAVKLAHQLLRRSELNFLGNAEGRDIVAGATERGPVDVVVCDGFVGNVLLKFYESVGPLVLGLLRRAGIDAALLERGFRAFDYSEYGGAPLLGVRGVSIISHGASSPQAIKNAVRAAVRAVETRMDEHIGRRLVPTAASAEREHA